MCIHCLIVLLLFLLWPILIFHLPSYSNEREGIPANLLQMLDVCVEIPQQGVIRSLNVHVSAALLIWEYTRQHLSCGPSDLSLKHSWGDDRQPSPVYMTFDLQTLTSVCSSPAGSVKSISWDSEWECKLQLLNMKKLHTVHVRTFRIFMFCCVCLSYQVSGQQSSVLVP